MDRKKVAFIFPGQGSQYAGMGLDISNHYPVAKDAFDRADDLLGYKISMLCWEKDESILMRSLRNRLKSVGDRFHLEFLDRLQKKMGKRPLLEYTRYSQPAVFTVSVACLEALRQELRQPRSLRGFRHHRRAQPGKHTALYAAKAFDFEEGLIAEVKEPCTSPRLWPAVMSKSTWAPRSRSSWRRASRQATLTVKTAGWE